MSEFILMLNANFTKEDKEKCLPTIAFIVDLAEKARTEGILAFELESHDEENIFLKWALQLVVDGRDRDSVKHSLNHLILADRHEGFELLSRLLIKEGVLSIMNGDYRSDLEDLLYAMLGEEYLEKHFFTKHEYKLSDNYKYLEPFKNQKALPESVEFEKLLLSLDRPTIQRILRDIEYDTLRAALLGCSIETIRMIVFENMSIKNCIRTCRDIYHYRMFAKKEHIISEQTSILKQIESLENANEIIIFRK